jgi:VWFA-related protein
MCRLRRIATLTLLTAALKTSFAASPQNAQTPQEIPVFRTSTAAVTVDVVVRNRRGEPVLGLTQEDFEVFEDGVPQRLINFAAMAGEAPAGENASAEDPTRKRPVASVAMIDTQSAVALVFHQLSHQSRAAAVKAGRSMVATLAPSERAGIFLVDLRLTMLAPFSRDRQELEAALDGVLKRPPVNVAGSDRGVAETDGLAGTYLTRDSAQAAEMQKRLQAGPEGPQHAAAQAASLSGLIASLARFSGRKAIILFSEGLVVSPRLEKVVDRARAENVTVYTINSRGLEGGGSMSLTGRQDIDRSELTGTSRGHRYEHRFPELDQTLGLGPLARHTGGILVSDANDLLRAMAAVNADRRAFYVLGYVSSNSAFDNTVRHIEVRVKRPQLSVRARTAYVAVKPDRR